MRRSSSRAWLTFACWAAALGDLRGSGCAPTTSRAAFAPIWEDPAGLAPVAIPWLAHGACKRRGHRRRRRQRLRPARNRRDGERGADLHPAHGSDLADGFRDHQRLQRKRRPAPGHRSHLQVAGQGLPRHRRDPAPLRPARRSDRVPDQPAQPLSGSALQPGRAGRHLPRRVQHPRQGAEAAQSEPTPVRPRRGAVEDRSLPGRRRLSRLRPLRRSATGRPAGAAGRLLVGSLVPVLRRRGPARLPRAPCIRPIPARAGSSRSSRRAAICATATGAA